MKLINLLVGGPTAEWPQALKKGQIKGPWIGADRGNLRLIKLGIDPMVAIGDFDSMNPNELKLVKQHVKDVRSFDTHKDFTDTELLLMAAIRDYDPELIRIYGATGGRIDHFLSNLFMVLEPRFRKYAERIKMIDDKNAIGFYLPGSHVIDKEPDKKYLAFVPLGGMHVSLSHVEYPFDHHWIGFPRSYSSNEFIGNYAKFSFDQNIMCVIQSKD
ncbi:MAG: thiamine diphosphokinase [Acetilactobacillus jinshanensis]